MYNTASYRFMIVFRFIILYYDIVTNNIYNYISNYSNYRLQLSIISLLFIIIQMYVSIGGI